MTTRVTIRPGGAFERLMRRAETASDLRVRSRAMALLLALAFLGVAGQLVRLGLAGQSQPRFTLAEPLARSHARPDIVDRHGRLLATDYEALSLYADPSAILDLDEVVEGLLTFFPGMGEAETRRLLEDRTRRFVWIRRGVSPALAQQIHDAGLPGLAFRKEPRRAYPAGSLASHVIGTVNFESKGVSGIERLIDERHDAEPTHGAARSGRAPVRLTLDIGVQHAATEELREAMQRYGAEGAAGLVLDVTTGEVLASVSLPDFDPSQPADSLKSDRLDRVSAGVYELGSIAKILAVAMGLELGIAPLDKSYDVQRPLKIAGYTIEDLHPARWPLTVRDIFIHSSNSGAAQIALEAGAARQRAFLDRLGLTTPMRTEAGPVAAPALPKRWGEIETATIAYGHGIAVAPLQFAAATAMLVNGGVRVRPTFLPTATARGDGESERVVSPAVSAALREVMRLNVTTSTGTGRRADVEGYRVGGKTGTAEMPGQGGYRETAVISSFLAVLPTDRPRYLTLVLLFEPKPVAETGDRITAGVNAAPVTARLVTRIAPILGILPRRFGTAQAG